ncbi:MAG: high-affinity nickel-transport family protein [Acidobacteriia bacterium]|nr:high-affinity nickel-transport family protein [Terriglobia bacterium]
MITLLSISVLGFFLGMRHATDPDHVIAVTTIVSRERNIFHAALIGVFWGLGHTFTILLVGSAIILFKLTIPARLGLSMELSVGFMLIVLGALNLTGAMQRAMGWITARGMAGDAHSHWFFGRQIVHAHEESGGPVSNEAFSLAGWTVVEGELSAARQDVQEGLEPFPPGFQVERESDSSDAVVEPAAGWRPKLSLFHIVRPLLVGIVHGLAGSAAVALLVLATISRAGWAIGYLLIFGLGTVAGMMLITAAIAIPFAYSMRRFARLNRGLALASGFLSVAFGIFLCYQIGFVEGLFTGHANWIPR